MACVRANLLLKGLRLLSLRRKLSLPAVTSLLFPFWRLFDSGRLARGGGVLLSVCRPRADGLRFWYLLLVLRLLVRSRPLSPRLGP